MRFLYVLLTGLCLSALLLSQNPPFTTVPPLHMLICTIGTMFVFRKKN